MDISVEIDDIIIYRGDSFSKECGRQQIVTFVDVNNTIFTKFIDDDSLNCINMLSGYFDSCEIIPKDKHKLELKNGIPLIWGDEN